MAPTGRPAADVTSPMVAASAVLGRKWHPVIVRLLLEDGPLGFSVIEEELGVSRKVLSESLSDLQEKGVVDRTELARRPTRVEYSLTEQGRALEGAVDELHRWGEQYLRETTEGTSELAGGAGGS